MPKINVKPAASMSSKPYGTLFSNWMTKVVKPMKIIL